MRITRLSIKNFRSIENLDLELPRICALVGPNNAGKSNILEALRRVLGGGWLNVGSFTSDDVFLRDAERSVEIVCHLDPSVSYKKLKNGTATEICALRFEYTRYKIGQYKGQPRLDQSCLNVKGEPAIVMTTAPAKGKPPQFGPVTSVPQDVRDQIPLIYIGTNRSLKEQLPGGRYSLLRQMFETIDRDLQDPGKTVLVKQPDGTEKAVPLKVHFNTLMMAAMELLRTEEFSKVEKAIKKNVLEQLGFDPLADADKIDFCFTPLNTLDFYKTLDLLMKEEGFSISAQEMGDGMQNAIVLGILQAFEETQKQGAILLIEEPEMFLHPQMQRSLYKTLRRIGEKNQVIYTTHSPHFVTVPEYNEVALVHKSAGKTGVRISSLITSPQRREKLVKELDPERNELFFARRLLLVEGDTEKLAFPEYAKALGIDLDRAGSSIVEVGGKRSLWEFAQIATSFGIPTGIVYDKDSSDFAGKQAEENAYNATLDSFVNAAADIRVWRFDNKYEDHLRKTLGEKKYQELCQKYPKVGKPTQARLIAMENGLPIPEPVEEILRWLGNRPKPVTQVHSPAQPAVESLPIA